MKISNPDNEFRVGDMIRLRPYNSSFPPTFYPHYLGEHRGLVVEVKHYFYSRLIRVYFRGRVCESEVGENQVHHFKIPKVKLDGECQQTNSKT